MENSAEEQARIDEVEGVVAVRRHEQDPALALDGNAPARRAFEMTRLLVGAAPARGSEIAFETVDETVAHAAILSSEAKSSTTLPQSPLPISANPWPYSDAGRTWVTIESMASGWLATKAST